MKSISSKSSGISTNKKILFSLIIFIILWLIADTLTYTFLKIIQNKYNIFYEYVIPNNKELEGYAKKYYHSKWGWDIFEEKKGQFGNRKGRIYIDKNEYKIKTFGDSYTYADDVDDNETWEHYIEELTSWECLNFGVLGFGTDQALLKYKDISIKTRYTILAILDENIGRLMCQWWGFYRTGGVGIKPKFYYASNGSVALIENPIKNVNDVKKMGDVNFLNELKNDDYWYNYYSSLGGPEKLTWPATFMIAKHSNFFIRCFWAYTRHKISPTFESETAIKKFYHLYDNDSDGLKIMRYIVEEFSKTARNRGETPIILIFPVIHTVDIFKKFSRKPHRPLIDYLKDKKSNYIDFTDIFVRERYVNYYQNKDGHFTVEGNKKVAGVLVDYIKQLEQQHHELDNNE